MSVTWWSSSEIDSYMSGCSSFVVPSCCGHALSTCLVMMAFLLEVYSVLGELPVCLPE